MNASFSAAIGKPNGETNSIRPAYVSCESSCKWSRKFFESIDDRASWSSLGRDDADDDDDDDNDDDDDAVDASIEDMDNALLMYRR